MVTDALIELFERDLLRVKHEIELYRNENNLWIIKEEISNSAGNLCLHLLGNLNHFIGATSGNTGYIRQRDDEFSMKHISREIMISNLAHCLVTVRETLQRLSAADLEKDFPLEKHGTIVSTENMLMHLYGHLSYHLGQINYHRRLLDLS